MPIHTRRDQKKKEDILTVRKYDCIYYNIDNYRHCLIWVTSTYEHDDVYVD